MKSLNKWIYGPTPEEKVRGWQQKLRQQERQLDREIMNVSPGLYTSSLGHIPYTKLAFLSVEADEYSWRELLRNLDQNSKR